MWQKPESLGIQKYRSFRFVGQSFVLKFYEQHNWSTIFCFCISINITPQFLLSFEKCEVSLILRIQDCASKNFFGEKGGLN